MIHICVEFLSGLILINGTIQSELILFCGFHQGYSIFSFLAIIVREGFQALIVNGVDVCLIKNHAFLGLASTYL